MELFVEMQDLVTETVALTVSDGSEMAAFVVRPNGVGPFPALMLLQEIFGVNAHIRSVARRLAAAGYTVIAPDLFHRTQAGYQGGYADMEPSLAHAMRYQAAQADRDIVATYDWCLQDSAVRSDRVAALGFCMGGKLAFVANALCPLAAAVSYYGGGLATDRLHLAPSLSGPTLFFWAGRDPYIPASDRRRIVDALTALNKPHIAVQFSEATHGFFCDARSDTHPASAEHAWALTIGFLAQHLQR